MLLAVKKNSSEAKMLKFSKGNTKIQNLALHMGYKKSHVVTFDLPAGHTCPAASLCLSIVDKNTGKRENFGEFICYATKAELQYKNVLKLRHDNYDTLLSCENNSALMANMLTEAMPKNVKLVRIHSSGDFFSKAYFNAWIILAENNPDVTFFAYTKILHYAAKNDLPTNLHIVYSYGGKLDSVRDQKFSAVPTCYVITKDKWTIDGDYATRNYDGLIVKIVCQNESQDHEDFFMIKDKKSFGIIVH